MSVILPQTLQSTQTRGFDPDPNSHAAPRPLEGLGERRIHARGSGAVGSSGRRRLSVGRWRTARRCSRNCPSKRGGYGAFESWRLARWFPTPRGSFNLERSGLSDSADRSISNDPAHPRRSTLNARAGVAAASTPREPTVPIGIIRGSN